MWYEWLVPPIPLLVCIYCIVRDVRQHKRSRRNLENNLRASHQYIRDRYNRTFRSCQMCVTYHGDYVPATHAIHMYGIGFGYGMCEKHFEKKKAEWLGR